MQHTVLCRRQDYWCNGKDGEYTINQKMVTVQGSPCAPSPLILRLITFTMSPWSSLSLFPPPHKWSYIKLFIFSRSITIQNLMVQHRLLQVLHQSHFRMAEVTRLESMALRSPSVA
jgi:hypothetical protein